MIEEYFLEVLEGIDNPDLAMVILYALCNYSRGLNLNDFKNLTFAPEEAILKMLNTLEEQIIISKIHNKPDSPYLMTHDYLIGYLNNYCRGKLFEQITVNIDFYCKEKSIRATKAKTKVKAKIEKDKGLSIYYKKTIADGNNTYGKVMGVLNCALCRCSGNMRNA
jgi:hypothetical protein